MLGRDDRTRARRRRSCKQLAEAEQHLRRVPRATTTATIANAAFAAATAVVDVGRRRERHLLRHLPGGGVEHVAGPGRGAFHELAVDPVGHEREGHAQEYAASTSGPPTRSDDSRPSGPPDLRLAEFRRAGVARQAHAHAARAGRRDEDRLRDRRRVGSAVGHHTGRPLQSRRSRHPRARAGAGAHTAGGS